MENPVHSSQDGYLKPAHPPAMSVEADTNGHHPTTGAKELTKENAASVTSSEPANYTGSIKVTKRTDRSMITRGFQKLVKPFRPRLTKVESSTVAGSQKLEINSKAKSRCNIVERQVESIYIYDMTSKTHPAPTSDHTNTNGTSQPTTETAAKPHHRIYYLAGGGWQAPPSPHHWKMLSLLAANLANTTISIVSYPLAPACPAAKALPLILTLYKTLLLTSRAEGEIVTLAGDSAGGNVVLATTLEALKQDPTGPAPDGLLLICPSVDLGRKNKDIELVEKVDPLMTLAFSRATASAWAGDLDLEDSRISPLNARNVAALRERGVKVDGLTGGHDILGPDAILFREKCDKEGVQGEWLEWEGQMHCWVLTKAYGVFPEGDGAFDWLEELLRRRGEGK